MRKLANRGINYLQKKFPVNRVVVLLTPLAFAPAAGFVSVEAAKLTGIAISPATMLGLFTTGAAVAGAKAYKWLDGWQKHEEFLRNR